MSYTPYQNQKPRNPNNEAIVEIRAGAGGDEAGLFAGTLFNMYKKYATLKGWGFEVIDSNETNIGGFKSVVFELKGEGLLKKKKKGGGNPRTGRDPKTKKRGRAPPPPRWVAWGGGPPPAFFGF